MLISGTQDHLILRLTGCFLNMIKYVYLSPNSALLRIREAISLKSEQIKQTGKHLHYLEVGNYFLRKIKSTTQKNKD